VGFAYINVISNHLRKISFHIIMNNEIDQLLATWQNQISAVTQNLLELQELPSYQRLCLVKLIGITATKVTPALAAMNDLFQHFDLLVQTVDKAIQLRQQLPKFLVSDQKIAEIKQLITGNSIELSVVKIPLAKRQLLSVNNQVNAITPDELLKMMIHAFSVARDTVLEVDAAWEKLDTIIADIQKQINNLQKLAISLGQNSFIELTQAENHLHSFQQRIEADPLGVNTEIKQEIQPLLIQVKFRLEQVLQQQTQLRDKLVTSHKLLEELQENHQKSVITFAESQEKIMDHSITQTPLSDEQITALNQWLIKLETKLGEGLVNPVMIGLDNWLNKARESNILAQEVHSIYSNLLQNRQELRGRLDALQAKALAKGLIEDLTLSDLAQKAKKHLYTRPTPINQASQLVTEYEKILNHKLKIENPR
jgi:hypothetical protein